jgi:hypothetical protein
MGKHIYTPLQRPQACSNGVKRKDRQHYFTVIFLATLALSACSPSAPLPAKSLPPTNSPTPASVSPVNSQALRVIVKFRKPVPYRDTAFLQDMTRHIHARVAYLGSVSPDTHVYQIEPEPGQSGAAVVQRLSALPSVLRVEIDTVAKPS